jgi:hypothetical protein
MCRQQAEGIQNHENEQVRGIGQGEARHRKYKRLKVGGKHNRSLQVAVQGLDFNQVCSLLGSINSGS